MELDRDVETGFETFVAKARLGKEDINEWSYVRKDQTRLPVRLIVSLLKDENEQLIGFIEMAEDITEIKKLEKMLDDQRQTMIEATRLSSLGEMAIDNV